MVRSFKVVFAALTLLSISFAPAAAVIDPASCENLFHEADTDGSGGLSLIEYCSAFPASCGLFNVVDSNKDGVVSIEEFLVTCGL
jgi:Ca2+-binding EF-hand superfamily protein